MENYTLDYEIYTNGISNEFETFDETVWDRGYYLETDEGVWYEMYVNETIKSYYPTIEEELKDVLSGFKGLWLGNYNDSSQITFFVPRGNEELTLDEMTNILI